jgi:hypothetical protein
VPDKRYDPAVHAAKAAEALEVAQSARAAFRSDIAERGARLGIERDELAAEIHATREQAAAAERQAKRELGEAEKLDRAADSLERQLIKPDPTARGLGEHIRDEELAEQVAEQRALADAARTRAAAADTRADTLETDSIRMRDNLVGLERQLAAEPDRRKAIEEQLDRLDDTATHFADMSRNATRIAEQERIASEAEIRGDRAMVDRANQLAETSRQSIDSGLQRQISRPDADILLQIGVTVPAGFADPADVTSAAPDSQGGITDASAVAAADTDTGFDGEVLTGEAAAAATDTAGGTESTFDELTGVADNTGFTDDTGVEDTTGLDADAAIGDDELGFVTPEPEPAPAMAFAEPESAASDFGDAGAFESDDSFTESADDGFGISDTLDG